LTFDTGQATRHFIDTGRGVTSRGACCNKVHESGPLAPARACCSGWCSNNSLYSVRRMIDPWARSVTAEVYARYLEDLAMHG
jgi:hypothetical protein